MSHESAPKSEAKNLFTEDIHAETSGMMTTSGNTTDGDSTSVPKWKGKAVDTTPTSLYESLDNARYSIQTVMQLDTVQTDRWCKAEHGGFGERCHEYEDFWEASCRRASAMREGTEYFEDLLEFAKDERTQSYKNFEILHAAQHIKRVMADPQFLEKPWIYTDFPRGLDPYKYMERIEQLSHDDHSRAWFKPSKVSFDRFDTNDPSAFDVSDYLSSEEQKRAPKPDRGTASHRVGRWPRLPDFATDMEAVTDETPRELYAPQRRKREEEDAEEKN